MLRDLLKSFEERGSEGKVSHDHAATDGFADMRRCPDATWLVLCAAEQMEEKMKFISELKQLPIAVETGTSPCVERVTMGHQA